MEFDVCPLQPGVENFIFTLSTIEFSRVQLLCAGLSPEIADLFRTA